MKKILLGLIFSIIATVASAQTCPTRPTGDNSNSCASTQFVNNEIIANTSATALKTPADVATTANITLSGDQTIDGVLLSSLPCWTGVTCRVLVKDQNTASQNGPYTPKAGAWTRTTDFDATGEVIQGTLIYVNQGTVYAHSTFEVSSANPIIIGSSSITFVAAHSNLPAPIVDIGTLLYPYVQNSISTTGTFINGNGSFTVVSATGVAIGMAVVDVGITGKVAANAVVTNVSGLTITMLPVATGSGTVAIRFGNDRWSPTSSVIANTLGVENIYVGGAALGNTSWVWKYVPGVDYPQTTAAQISNSRGGIGLYMAGRTSDTTVSYPNVLVDGAFALIDDSAAKVAWARYTQVTTLPGTTGYAFGEENSMETHWVYTAVDPYNYNPLLRATNARLDCGIGVAFYLDRGAANNCSAAMDIVQNGSKYGTGILFGADALDVSSGSGPALAMAPGHALAWYYGTGTKSWNIYSNATAAGGIQLYSNHSTNLFGPDGTTSYHFMDLTGGGVMTFGASTGDQLLVQGSVAGAGFVQIGASSSIDTNVGLVLEAQGTGTIRAANPFSVPASTTSASGFNIPQGVAPTAPVNGDIWPTSTALFARIGGVTYQYATLAGTEILANKTISGTSNTLTNIGNGSLTNSSTTVNGQTCTLGSTCTVTATASSTLTFGTHLTGASYNGSVPVTIATDAVSTNTNSTIVARDGSGNFSAGTITAGLTGNASTATALQTARAINGVNFDGTAPVTVTAAAGTLTGATLNSGVIASSLTSLGTLTSTFNVATSTQTVATFTSSNASGGVINLTGSVASAGFNLNYYDGATFKWSLGMVPTTLAWGVFDGAGGNFLFSAIPNGNLTISPKGGTTAITGTVTISALAQTSAAQSGTVCYNTSGVVTYDATLGCLASTMEVKDEWTDFEPEAALSKVLGMKAGRYFYKKGLGLPAGEQIGFNAQQMETVDDRLVAHKPGSDELLGVRYQQASALYAPAIQALMNRITKLENAR